MCSRALVSQVEDMVKIGAQAVAGKEDKNVDMIEDSETLEHDRAQQLHLILRWCPPRHDEIAAAPLSSTSLPLPSRSLSSTSSSSCPLNTDSGTSSYSCVDSDASESETSNVWSWTSGDSDLPRTASPTRWDPPKSDGFLHCSQRRCKGVWQ